MPREILEQKTFKSIGTFESYYDACRYIRSKGYCEGSMCGDLPIGFAKDSWPFAQKWRNMTPRERNMVDGIITSTDFREGEVTVTIYK